MIGVIRDIANIVFFVVMSLLTVLSYLHARKTLFAPIRTETFKLQLKLLEELLAFFQNKSETDFYQVFDLPRILSLNTLQMADRYVVQFFPSEMKIDEEKRSKMLSPLIGVVVAMKDMEKYFKTIEAGPPAATTSSEDRTISNPAIALAHWLKYEHGMVGYTQKYLDSINEISRFAASPLLPRTLREYIVEFETVARENLVLIGKVVTDCSREMPEHYPTSEDIKGFTTEWIWNQFNHQSKEFESCAKKILGYLNKYLKVESIME